MAKKKSKKFVVATEGATVDGRTIERSWIEQMAASYDKAIYTAGINIEHIRTPIPDGLFKNYGVVDAVSTHESADGKLQLLVEISPSEDLVRLVGSYQKLFTSIEINTKFADTNKAYLIGLAVTDTPASLGTDMLEFTASKPEGSPLTARKQDKGNHFSVATETTIEFEDVTDTPGLLDRVKAIFTAKNRSDDKRFSDIEQAIEEVATHGQTQSTATQSQLREVDTTVKATQQRAEALDVRLKALEEAFGTTPAKHATRPPAAGNGDVLTDF